MYKSRRRYAKIKLILIWSKMARFVYTAGLKSETQVQGGSRELTFTCKHKYSLKRFLVRVCFGRRNEWSAVFWALLLSKQHSKQAGRSLCFDHLFCLLLPAHAAWQPAWAKSSRQNRWSMHTHRQECHLRKRKNIALGTFLNSGLAQWANKKNSSFKPSYAHPYKWTQKE